MFFCLFILLCSLSFAETKIDPDYVIGQKWFQKGDFKSAEESWLKVLKTNFDHLDCNYSLAKIYYLQQRHIEAFRYLRETLSLDPNYKDAKILFQEVLETLNLKYGKTESKEKDILNVQIYLDLTKNDLTQARFKIDKMLKLYPDEAFAYDHLANYHYQLKQLDESLQMLKKAISLNPASPTIFKHYETTFYLKNHRIQPGTKPPALDSLTEKIKDPAEPSEADSVKPSVAETKVIASVGDSSFFEKFLKEQEKKLPPPEIKKPVEEKKPESVYIPPPPVSQTVTNASLAQEELIKRATQAYDAKNWEMAGTTYLILATNNPGNQEYKDKAKKARAYEQFEIDLKAARRELALGAKSPENLKTARNKFEALDLSLYKELYHKNDVSDFLGRIAMSLNEKRDAARHFETWLKSEPKDSEISYLYILCLEQLGLSQKASKEIERIQELVPEALDGKPGIQRIKAKLFVVNYWWIALVILLIWGSATGIYTYIKLRRVKMEQDRRYQFQLVRELTTEKRWLELIRKTDELLVQDLSESEIYGLQYAKANALFQSNQIENAERQLISVLSRFKNDQNCLALLGRIYTRQARTELECLEAYNQLFAKEPNHLPLLKIYLATMKKNNLYGEEAEKVALRILELENYNRQVLQDLIDIFVKQENKSPKAMNVYRQYLDLNPGNVLVMLHYLESLIQNEDYIQAVRTGKQLVEINPDLERAHRLLIMAYDKLSMYEEMKTFYSQMSLDYAQSNMVQNMYNLISNTYKSSGATISDENFSQQTDLIETAFHSGRELIKKGNLKAAIVKLQQATTDKRFHFDAAISLCYAFLEMQDFASAKLYYEALNLHERRLGPEALEVIYRMAEGYTLSKEKDKALRCYQLIAKNDVSFKDTFQRIELLTLDS